MRGFTWFSTCACRELVLKHNEQMKLNMINLEGKDFLFPKLRELKLVNLRWRWSQQQLPDLQKLELDHVTRFGFIQALAETRITLEHFKLNVSTHKSGIQSSIIQSLSCLSIRTLSLKQQCKISRNANDIRATIRGLLTLAFLQGNSLVNLGYCHELPDTAHSSAFLNELCSRQKLALSHHQYIPMCSLRVLKLENIDIKTVDATMESLIWLLFELFPVLHAIIFIKCQINGDVMWNIVKQWPRVQQQENLLIQRYHYKGRKLILNCRIS